MDDDEWIDNLDTSIGNCVRQATDYSGREQWDYAIEPVQILIQLHGALPNNPDKEYSIGDMPFNILVRRTPSESEN